MSYLVRIKELKRSCVCTSAEISKWELSPGEAADLRLDVKIAEVFNSWDVSCSVVTDIPGESNWPFTLSYRTYPHVRFTDGSVRLRESTESGSAFPRRLKGETWLETYELADSESQEVTLVRSQGPIVVELESGPAIDLIEAGRIRRRRQRVGVALDAQPGYTSPGGVQAQTIVATEAHQHTASTVATWSIASALSVTPSRMSFGLVHLATSPSLKRVFIKSRDGRNFRLLAANNSRREIEVRGVPSANQSTHAVEVAFCAASKTAARQFVAGEIILITDHPNAPESRSDGPRSRNQTEPAYDPPRSVEIPNVHHSTSC